MPKLDWDKLPLEQKHLLARGNTEMADILAKEQREQKERFRKLIMQGSKLLLKSVRISEEAKKVLENTHERDTKHEEPEEGIPVLGPQSPAWLGQVLETLKESENPQTQPETLERAD